MAGINLLLARGAYEVVHSRMLHHAIAAALQRQLDGLRRPPYLGRMLLQSMDLGSASPRLRGVRLGACPGSSGALAPQLHLQLEYEVGVSWLGGVPPVGC
jgi:hypothetical protein